MLYNGKCNPVKQTPTYVVFQTDTSEEYFLSNPHVVYKDNHVSLNLDASKEVYYVNSIPNSSPLSELPKPPQEYLDSIPMKIFDSTLKSSNHYIVSHSMGYDFRLPFVYSHNVFTRICKTDIDKYGKFLTYSLPLFSCSSSRIFISSLIKQYHCHLFITLNSCKMVKIKAEDKNMYEMESIFGGL